MKVDLHVRQAMWIRVGALGDLLISLEALKAACERFPNGKIWVVGSRLWLELIDPSTWPQINGIIISEDGQTGQLHELDGSGAWVESSKVQSLKELAKRCQASVNLRIESFRFVWFAWPQLPMRIGSCPPIMRWLYTHWLPWLGKEPMVHERDWYVMVVNAPRVRFFDFSNYLKLDANKTGYMQLGDQRIDIPFPVKKVGLPALKKLNEMKLKSLWKLEKGNYITLNPTASIRDKVWPSTKYRELALKLLRENKIRGAAGGDNSVPELVVVGSPLEIDWLREVAGTEFRIIQPKVILDLADLIGGARFLLTNTSSVQFVAASMKTPCVTLMGIARQQRWGPLGAEDITIRAEGDFSHAGNMFQREKAAYDSIRVERVYEVLTSTKLKS